MSNRVCTACATRCTIDEYEDTPCTEFSDRICKPLKKDLSVQFEMKVSATETTEEAINTYRLAVAKSLGIDPKYVNVTVAPTATSRRRMLQSELSFLVVITIPEAEVEMALVNATSVLKYNFTVQLPVLEINETMSPDNNVTVPSVSINVTEVLKVIVEYVATLTFETAVEEALNVQSPNITVKIVNTTVVAELVREPPPNCPPGMFCVGSDYFDCSEPCEPGTYMTRACSNVGNQICSPCPPNMYCLGGLHNATCLSGCDPGTLFPITSTRYKSIYTLSMSIPG